MFIVHRVLLFTHVLFAFLYMLSHGASVAVAHRLRRETNVERIRAMLDLSWSTVTVGYYLLMVLFLSGVTLGFIGHWWHARWIWASLAILVTMIVVMAVVAAAHFHRIRAAVGLPTIGGTPHPTGVAAPPEELAKVILAGHPRAVAMFGVVGWGAIVWMMLFKPG
jgi:hypothetical protein